MTLGMWQGIFAFEHRRAPHQRSIVVSILGVLFSHPREDLPCIRRKLGGC
jgi:hypothetical protein